VSATEIRPGWTAEMEALVATHLRLVHFVVNRRRNQIASSGIGFDDAVAEGMLTLCNAAMGYDPSRGIAFSTYAVNAIENRFNTISRRHAMLCRYGVVASSIEEHAERFGANVEDPNTGLAERRSENAVAAVREAVAALPAQYREVLLRRMAGDKLNVIARSMGRTEWYVRSLESRAMRRAKKLLQQSL
jgi:RNA polymerase sigma factor (sigma-70 family)